MPQGFLPPNRPDNLSLALLRSTAFCTSGVGAGAAAGSSDRVRAASLEASTAGAAGVVEAGVVVVTAVGLVRRSRTPASWPVLASAEPRMKAVYAAVLNANDQRAAAREMARRIDTAALRPEERELVKTAL